MTGVDFAGPLFVCGLAREQSKVYLCLFTCASTRAVHLELVEDLPADTFVRAFRRFISRRGTPECMISDNAKTFKASSSSILVSVDQLYASAPTSSFLADRGITWRFIVERAPWWGGFYERLVGMVKRCLKKILGKVSLKMMELITVLNKIEAILNSRPLTYPYSDINDGPPLMPSHFLCGYRLMSLPSPHEPSQEKDPDYTPTESSKEILTSKARYHARLTDRFWSIWRREYLTDLREFHSRYIKGKRVSKESNIKVGDIVLVHDNLPCCQWRLATVTRVIPSSKDGLVRAASLHVSNGNEIRRPIEKLYPLEISEDSEQTMATPKVDEPAIKGARPNPREFAIRARLKIKQQAVVRSDLTDCELYSSRLSNTCGI